MPRHLFLVLSLAALIVTLGARWRPVAAAEKETTHTAGAAEAASTGGHAAHGGPAEEGQPNILEPQPSLAIWTVVVFLGLLLLLGRFAWKPLLEALHQREAHLEHVLHDTERARNEAEALLAEHRRLMAEAQDKVRSMLDAARTEAQAVADEINRKAQDEAEAARHRAERDIANARDQALIELWSKSAELAVSVAGKVLARELGPDEHHRLIQRAINELPAAPVSANGHGGAPA